MFEKHINMEAQDVKKTEEELEFEGHPINVTGVNYLVRSATTMMTGLVVLLFTLSSLLQLLLSSVAFPL